MPPESSIETSTIRLTLMPLATAAVCDMPVARRSKPKRVRLSSTQKPTPTSDGEERQRPDRRRRRRSNGYQPPSWLLAGIGVVLVRRCRRGRRSGEQVADQDAGDRVQHDRRDDLADAAGDLAGCRRCRPRARPTTMATTNVSEDVEEPGQDQAAPANVAATYDASVYWPSTPMLNRFIRKPIAAASAER